MDTLKGLSTFGSSCKEGSWHPIICCTKVSNKYFCPLCRRNLETDTLLEWSLVIQNFAVRLYGQGHRASVRTSVIGRMLLWSSCGSWVADRGGLKRESMATLQSRIFGRKEAVRVLQNKKPPVQDLLVWRRQEIESWNPAGTFTSEM